VIPVFSPPKLFGGSQRVAYLVSKGLVKKGHEVVIYTSDMSNLQERVGKFIENINGVTIVHFRNISPFLSRKTRIIITPEMTKSLEIEIKNFDIIHVHEARSFQHLVVWWLARKKGVPYVVQAHGNLSEHFGGFFRRIYDELFGKKILKDASRVIAVNKVEARDYARFGVQEGKVEIIPNPVDMDEFCNLTTRGAFREKYNIKPDSKIILFMGRIHPVKGVDILLHAFGSIVKERKVNATLVVAGPDDGYLKECINIAKMYQLNNVIFTGQLGDLERIHAYLDADVVVIPSKYEMFPMTALEAYACGKPVVASKVGGVKDLVVEKVTGLLVEQGNVNQLAYSLLFLLNNVDRANEMGLRGKCFVRENFSIEKIVYRLEQLYEDVINTCKS